MHGLAQPWQMAVHTAGKGTEAIDAAPSNKPPIFIDKITMTLEIGDPDHQIHLRNYLFDMPKDLDSGWQPGTRGSYRAAARVHPRSDDTSAAAAAWSKEHVLIQADPRNGEGGYIRFEWNPAKLSNQQRSDIFQSFDAFLDLPSSKFWAGKVTRIDIATDLPGVRLADLVFERVKSPCRSLVYKKGKLETLYLGTKFKGQVTVYDKAAQMRAPGDLTRVEVRARPNCAAHELLTINNPFAKVSAYDVLHADLGLSGPLVQALHMSAQARGVAAALGIFPQHVVAKHVKAIKDSKAGFWEPEAIWQTWPAAVTNALPPIGLSACCGQYEPHAGYPLAPTAAA